MKSPLLFKSSTFLIAITALLLISCRSAEFIANRERTNQEVTEVLQSLKEENKRKEYLLGALRGFIAGYDNDHILVDVESLKRINEKRREFIEVNENFNLAKLNRRKIQGFFERQAEFQNFINALVMTMDKNPEVFKSQSYTSLLSGLERNRNLTRVILKKYNGIIEKNATYVKYPKYEIIDCSDCIQ